MNRIRQITVRLVVLAWGTIGFGHAALADGFAPGGLREVARGLGIGTGPGYHNQPCDKRSAAHYHRVTTGATDLRHHGWPVATHYPAPVVYEDHQMIAPGMSLPIAKPQLPLQTGPAEVIHCPPHAGPPTEHQSESCPSDRARQLWQTNPYNPAGQQGPYTILSDEPVGDGTQAAPHQPEQLLPVPGGQPASESPSDELPPGNLHNGEADGGDATMRELGLRELNLEVHEGEVFGPEASRSRVTPWSPPRAWW